VEGRPQPGPYDAGQLIIASTRIPVTGPGGVFEERAEDRAARRGIQRQPGREPGRGAAVPRRAGLRGPGHPRTPPPAGHRIQRGPHRGLPRPGRRSLGPGPAGGQLEGLGDQRRQLSVIQPRRRRVVGVLVLIQVTGVLIIKSRYGGQVVRVPVRALGHQPPVR
jgi:hypothetical protein